MVTFYLSDAPTKKVSTDIEATAGHDNRAFHGDDLDLPRRKRQDGGPGGFLK